MGMSQLGGRKAMACCLRREQDRFLLALLLLLAHHVIPVVSQISDPIAHDDNVLEGNDNKFLKRSASKDNEPYAQEEASGNEECPVNLELLWQTEVSSSIYSTPLIADINRDGKAEIVVPSFVHYLEVLDGDDGEKTHGWPAFYHSSAHSSPVLHDLDLDGMREVLLADYNGQILVFNYAGQERPTMKMTVPRLQVRKDWFVGLNPDHVDHTHPDIQADIVDKTTQPAASNSSSGQGARTLEEDKGQAVQGKQPAVQQQQHEGVSGGVSQPGEGGAAQNKAQEAATVAERSRFADEAESQRQQQFEQQRRSWMERERQLREARAKHEQSFREQQHQQQQQQHQQHHERKAEHEAPTQLASSGATLSETEVGVGVKEQHIQEPAKVLDGVGAHSDSNSTAPSTNSSSPCDGGLCTAAEHAGAGLGVGAGGNSAPHTPGGNASDPHGDSGKGAGAGGGAGEGQRSAADHLGLDHPPDVPVKEATAEQVKLRQGWETWHANLIKEKGLLDPQEAEKWNNFLEWKKGLKFPDDQQASAGAGGGGGTASQRRRLLSVSESPGEGDLEIEEVVVREGGDLGSSSRRRLMQVEDKEVAGEKEEVVEAGEKQEQQLDEDAAQSWDVFKDEDDFPFEDGVEDGEEDEHGHEWNEEWDEGDWNVHGEEGQGEEGVAGSQGGEADDEEEEEEVVDPHRLGEHHEEGHPRSGTHDPDLHDEYPYEYDDYVDEKMWEDEDWNEDKHETLKDFVGVDAHILCTPSIADVDNDGADELVVAASYYYDKEYYDDPEHAKELEEGIDLGKYIAGGIVVFSLQTQQVRWSLHLDLTTDNTQFRAYIYSSPTLVDLDKDGALEIVVGTSVGFIYVLTADGHLREGWPVQMGEIQGQVAVGDINHDGKMEIIGVDTRGNVAVFDIDGKEVWERHTASLIAQGATLGDVNGDGICEVVVGTTAGYVYAFNGVTGKDIPGFPFRTHGRIMAPVLIVDLSPAKRLPDRGRQVIETDKVQKRPGELHMVVMSFDGFLYAIAGSTACADVYDIGETSYSMVLADNIDGGDDLDLLVTTMNGGVYCFSTSAAFHPLKAWPSQTHGRNVFFPQYGHEGIFALPASRTPRDIGRENFQLSFEIVDTRVLPAQTAHQKYRVQGWLLFQGKRKMFLSKTYEKPGKYTVVVDSPLLRTHATLMLDMEDERRFLFHDEFSLSFHMHFYRLLKWILILPFVAMALALLLRAPTERSPELLPSYAARGHIA